MDRELGSVAEWDGQRKRHTITATDMYERYCHWCSRRGEEAVSLPRFMSDLKRCGAKAEKVAGRIRYVDVKWKEGKG